MVHFRRMLSFALSFFTNERSPPPSSFLLLSSSHLTPFSILFLASPYLISLLPTFLLSLRLLYLSRQPRSFKPFCLLSIHTHSPSQFSTPPCFLLLTPYSTSVLPEPHTQSHSTTTTTRAPGTTFTFRNYPASLQKTNNRAALLGTFCSLLCPSFLPSLLIPPPSKPDPGRSPFFFSNPIF